METPTRSSGGIYSIKNTVTGKEYIGSAVNIARRLSRHKTELNKGIHCNAKLQRAWMKYGKDSFLFLTIEIVVDAKELIKREQYWLNEKESVCKGYNICPTAGSILGTKKEREGIEKTAAAHRGMKRSPETCAKIKEARAKQPPLSEESKRKLAEKSRGRVVSLETRAKLSAVNKGRKASPEDIEKNRAKQLGKTPSLETREKLRILSTGRVHTAESRSKMSAWQIGRKMSPESIEKSKNNRVVTDNTRRLLSEAGKLGKGKKKPAGFGDKIRIAQTGKKYSKERCENISKSMIGRVFSKETIEKRKATRSRNNLLRYWVAL